MVMIIGLIEWDLREKESFEFDFVSLSFFLSFFWVL